jgi:predicted dehydrogenase
VEFCPDDFVYDTTGDEKGEHTVSKQIKIGIVGCGHITAAHLNGFKVLKEKGLLAGTAIKALCNPTEWKAESFRKRGEGPQQQAGVGPPGDPMQAPPVWVSDFQQQLPSIYSDYREMMSKEDINTIFVLSSVFTHHEIGMSAVEKGMDVLIEKPITVSVKAGRELVASGAEKGIVIGVAECIRYSPLVRMTRWCIEEGFLGDVQFTLYVDVGGYWSPDKIVGKTSWRHKRYMAAGGAAVDWMVHVFDRLRYTVGEIDEITGLTPIVEPVRVTRDETGHKTEEVDCETDDSLSCTVRFENGAFGNIMVSWAGHGEETILPQIYYGTKGCIKGDRIILDGAGSQSLYDFFERHSKPDVKERIMPAGIDNMFALQILDFLNAIGEGRPMETNGEEGVRDLACCFAAMEAGLQNRPIEVRDVLRGKVASYEADINKHYKI